MEWYSGESNLVARASIARASIAVVFALVFQCSVGCCAGGDFWVDCVGVDFCFWVACCPVVLL